MLKYFLRAVFILDEIQHLFELPMCRKEHFIFSAQVQYFGYLDFIHTG